MIKNTSTKGLSTIILKLAVVVMGLIIAAGCIWVLPQGILTDKVGYYRPILIGMYIPAIPFFLGLFNAMQLIELIDIDQVFTEKAIKVLRNIKVNSLVISILYIAGMPYIYYAAERDDAPGVILIGLVIIMASFVVATAAGVFESLVKNAVELKSENDLTV